MQVKIFNIPVPGGEMLNEEMNVFLRSKRVLSVEHQLVLSGQNPYLCFVVRFLEDYAGGTGTGKKIDYREALDPTIFGRFANFKDIRKRVAQEDGVPAFAVFTDEELAELAKIEPLNAAAMKSIKGIGEKRVEKYGRHFFTKLKDEKSQPPD